MTPSDLIVQAKNQNLSCERYHEKIQREIKTQTSYNESFIVKIMDCVIRFMTWNTYSLKYQVRDAKEETEAFTEYQSQVLEGIRSKIQPRLMEELVQKRQSKELESLRARCQPQLKEELVQERRSKALKKLKTGLTRRVVQKVTQLRETKVERERTFQNIQKELELEQAPEGPQLNDETEVSRGHGEWIVTGHNGIAFEQVDVETYGRVFQLFEKYHPVKWALEQDPPALQQRVDRLRAEVKSIDDSLELTFIPRTLYELTFLKECVKEDLAKENAFPYKDPKNPTKEEQGELTLLCKATNNSWVKDRQVLDWVTDVAQSKEFLELAHRLNGVFCRIINANLKNLSNFSYGQLKNLLEKHLHFFQELHGDSLSQLSNRARRTLSCNGRSVLTNFFCESTRGSITPMGIEKEENADILRKALPLECREGKIVLYRGTPTFAGDKAMGYSKSYGAGIFSGCINDHSATAFWYMRKKGMCAYALVLDAKDLPKKIFFVPSEHALIQIFRSGEYFHGRSMIGTGKNTHRSIGGIDGCPSYAKIPAFLKSDLEAPGQSILYDKYKQLRNVILKSEEPGYAFTGVS
jgi:hypothetical protein